MKKRDSGPDGWPDRRVISDKELSFLLTRASEFDAEGNQSLARTGGRPLAEVESIAREAGISRESLHRALAELGPGQGRGVWTRRLFGNLKPGTHLHAEGKPGDGRLDEILDSIAGMTRLRGGGTIRRHRMHWSSDGYENLRSGKALDIAVTPEAEGTDVSVRYDLRNAAGGIYGGICGGLGLGWGFGLGMGVGLGVLHSPLVAVLFPLAGIVGSFLLARGLLSLVSRRSRREAERIAGLIAGSIEEKESPAPPPASEY